MSDELFIAVDGGASTTRVRVVDRSGKIAERQAGASSLTLLGAGAWGVIRGALKDAGIGEEQLGRARIGLGLAGANDRRQRETFLAAAPKVAGLALATDAYTALIGAHAGAPSAIVIAGTGSVGCRLLPDGRLRLVGGWGFPVGDEGSGAWIGWRALGSALMALDGRVPDSPLAKAVREHCGQWRDDLLHWLRGAPSTRYAELAPIVLAHAAKGDAGAVALLTAAGHQLDRLASALDSSRAVPLALLGGLAAPLAPYLPPALTSWARAPRGDALDGALALARGEAPPERLQP
ncbi:MAG: ATPase [Alphaproteobacteria bacterium]|nr:ATPase [Alphaproteobacteria bacterium]